MEECETFVDGAEITAEETLDGSEFKEQSSLEGLLAKGDTKVSASII